MGESIQHINLVSNIFKSTMKMIPKDFSCLILVDLPDSKEKPPQVMNGYRPDLYYCHDNVLIIGEAKTSADFDRRHSIAQYLSFMETCANYIGTSCLIIAIPWTEYLSAKNLLKRMKKRYELDIQVNLINDLGKEEVL